jgi:NAD(P)H-flavin reductase
MQKFKAKVSRHELLAGSFQYFHFELMEPHRIDFQAGQYIILTVDEEKGIRRNYSIASGPEMNHAIELLIDIWPKGSGSMYLASLAPGDEIEFVGPVGSFMVKEEDRELLFVATGSGIAPLRAMVFDQLITKKNTNPIRLWWGMRYQKDCFWVEDFDVLEKEHSNFQWDLSLSRPPEGWPLHSGHVTGHVLEYVKQVSSKKRQSLVVYLCGNRQMIEEVSTNLKEVGILDNQIHFEKFF